MSEHIPETSENTTAKRPSLEVLARLHAQRATVAAHAAGDAMARYVLGPPRGSLRLTKEQIRDLQGLIRAHRDDSMGDPVACLESMWATLVDRLTEGS